MRHNILARTNVFDASEKEAKTNASSGRNNFNKSNNSSTKPLTTFTTSSPHTTNNSLHSKSTYFYQWFSGKDSKNTLTTNKLSYSIPFICGMAFLVGIGLVINPISSSQNNASAVGSDGNDNYGIETYATNGSMAITMNDSYYPDDKSDSSTNVIEAGTTAYRRYGFTVSSQSSNGYRLYVQAAPGYTGELRGLAHPRETISGVSGETTGSTMPTNTWGYTLVKNVTNPNTVDAGSQSYKAVPENGSVITPSFYSGPTETTNGTNFSLIFGANFGSDKPADHYQTKVLLSLAADASKVATLSTITNMQEMTAKICSDSAIHETKKLRDVRDQKLYWVAKLKDNNCWMVQNLDYDLPVGTNVTVSKNNTDLTTDRENLTIVGYTNTTSVEGWSNDGTILQYYNPGLYVYTTPTEHNGCGGSGVPNLSDCASFGWKEYQPGDDEHYLAGNYYSWKAVTVGGVISNNMASGSVCPYGWKLPAGDRSTSSFFYLLKSYGFDLNSDNSYGSVISSTGQNIASAPLYFVRGGAVNRNGVYNAGYAGFIWSGSITPNETLKAQRMLITGSIASSLEGGYYLGSSIRCLAR